MLSSLGGHAPLLILHLNTYVPGTNPVLSGLGLVINPITWTREETLATTAEGLGSLMPNASGVFSRVAQYGDARVDKDNGVLICSTADEDALFRLSGALGRGVYHSFDYPFYYYNLRANAANRAAKFLSNNHDHVRCARQGCAGREQIKIGNKHAEAYESGSATNNINIVTSQ